MLLLAGGGVLIVGFGLGMLIGRVTVAPPDPPPVSASILPEQAGLPDGDPMGSNTQAPVASVAPVAPAIPANAPPALAPPPVSPPPVVQQAALPPPHRATVPAPALASRKPPQPAYAKPVAPAPKPPVDGHAKSERAETEPTEPGPRWVVQLGAFQSSDHANLLVNTLAAHGQPAQVHFAKGLFYVQTPPYRSAAAAKTAAQALTVREHLPFYLVKLPAEAG